jgi:hypothetical protein
MSDLKITSEEREKILAMSRFDMCQLYRFAPCGHPYFDRTNPLSEVFDLRFTELGRFSPAISKAIGL